MIIKLIALALLSQFVTQVMAVENLVVIEAVSRSGKSFAIQKGASDGISEGQESLFSSSNASFVAIASVVKRHTSLWRIRGDKGAVPFKKDDIVTYENSIENIWTGLPELELTPIKELTFRSTTAWVIRAHLGQALSESVSSTDESLYEGRTSSQLSIFYNRMATPSFEWGLGVRLDIESSKQANGITIPTQRQLIAGEVNYHLEPIKSLSGRIYLGAGIAAGLSTTSVNEEDQSGMAYVLPALKLGYLAKLKNEDHFLAEITCESVAASESLSTGEEQNTNLINAKVGIGYRF